MVLKTAIQNLTTLKGFILLDLKKFNTSATGMDNWKELFNKNIADRQTIDFVLSNKRTTAILRYYDDPGGLRDVLEPLTYEKRVKFLDGFGEISTPNYNKILIDSDIINSWLRYFEDLSLRSEFKAMGENGMIEWCEHYGILSQNLINEIKAKPLTFKNWNNLVQSDKQLLKTIPEEWIPSVHQFDNFCFIKKFCPVDIPSNATIKAVNKEAGYKQVTFEWIDSSGFKFKSRVHEPIPGSDYYNDGQVWIINRIKSGSPDGSLKRIEEILLNDNSWFKFEDRINVLGSDNWKGLINRQKRIPPIITPEEQEILAKGHFKAK